MERLKRRVYEVLEVAREGDVISRLFDVFITALILLNVLAVILETVESLAARYGPFFRVFEVFSVIVFTVEYLLRLWSCTVDERFKGFFVGRVRFAVTPLAVVDLLAILPFYAPVLIPYDLRFVRALRLLRFLRLLKIGRYSESIRIIADVLKAKKAELAIAALGELVLLVLASCLMYFVEHEAQPEAFSSIPAAMWWAVVTLTTVGYGDVYPVTPLGKFLGSMIALLGIAMFALPAGILASGFAERIRSHHGGKKIICPHCKREIVVD